jgi:transcriptional regulator with XRE-family HTH domain
MHASINSMIQKIWKKMKNKEYRDSFVGAHLSNTVASQISMLREQNNWTQKQLAVKAGMKHQSRISCLEDPNYENIEISTLRKLASAFDVALTVRFVPFSELAEWSATLSPQKLMVPNFDIDDIDRAKPRKADDFVVSIDVTAGDGLVIADQARTTDTSPEVFAKALSHG